MKLLRTMFSQIIIQKQFAQDAKGLFLPITFTYT